MRAADVIVKCLEAHGVRRVYVVPGESFLSVLDALHDSGIEIIVCRQEGGAGFMAVAEAKITGKPAVVMVSRGPGVTNASIAVHVAEQDAVPLLVIVGQVSRAELTRGAFQEVNYSQFFGGIAKGVFEMTDGRKAAELVTRALAQSAKGTPGPVVLSLPEDAQDDEADDMVPAPYPLPIVRHAVEDANRLQAMLDAAERPLIIAGSCFRGDQRSAVLQRFAEAQRLPVAVTWKNQDVFDNGSALYAGHLGFGAPAAYKQLLSQADLIVAVGTRLGDIASLNYELPRAPVPAQRLVHIYPDAKPLGQVFSTELSILADPVGMLAALATQPRVVSSARESWCSILNDYVRKSQAFSSVDPSDGVDFGSVVVSIAREAPDAIVTTDAGNMSSWVHRHWVMTPRNMLLGSIAGAMGFGVPAAVAAAIEQPDRMAICFVGDGGILMTGQEIATAVAYGAKPKIVLSDNGIYGTIRTHQEKHFPGRVSGTNLVNPDFTLWAKSFGIEAFPLKPGDDVEGTIAAFLSHDGAALLHVHSSRQALSAFSTLKNG